VCVRVCMYTLLQSLSLTHTHTTHTHTHTHTHTLLPSLLPPLFFTYAGIAKRDS
jgi:hypothetical protein